VIYAYGNSSASDQENKTSVWDTNYTGVWHLPNGTTLSANDSTTNANTGTLNNSPTATTGEIGGAASFASASSQYISTPSQSSLKAATTFTVSAWMKRSSTGTIVSVVHQQQTRSSYAAMIV
jgi:hypothetical protein